MEQDVVVAKQISSFDVYSSFRNLLSPFKYTNSSRIRLLFHEFKRNKIKRSNQRVLDFGFGDGRVLFWFNSDSEICGIEVSDKAIRYALRKAIKKRYTKYTFLKPPLDDSVRIPFPDNFFDIVISCHSIEHVYDDEKLLKEFFRVCRGKIFIVIPIDVNNESLFLEKNNRLNPEFPKKSFHVFRYNLRTMQEMVRRANFKIVSSYIADAVMDFLNRKSSVLRPLNVFFSILPYSLWKILDGYFKKKGYSCKQGVVVAQK